MFKDMYLSNQLKDHVGEIVEIRGWLHTVRVVSSNLAFLIVRDRGGLAQVVFEDPEEIKKLDGGRTGNRTIPKTSLTHPSGDPQGRLLAFNKQISARRFCQMKKSMYFCAEKQQKEKMCKYSIAIDDAVMEKVRPFIAAGMNESAWVQIQVELLFSQMAASRSNLFDDDYMNHLISLSAPTWKGVQDADQWVRQLRGE